MDKYAVIGNPVEHSRSPRLHTAFAKQANLTIQYEKIKAPLMQFKETLLDFYKSGGRGCNITLPFKTEAFELASKLSQNAARAHSVNCLKFLDTGEIEGENFDGPGLVQDLQKNKKFPLLGLHILVLGAGGAARGILQSLLEENPASLTLTNRTFPKADSLASLFTLLGPVHALKPNALGSQQFDLILNATSAGHTKTAFKFPESTLKSTTLCYDLSYGEIAHPFLTHCKSLGCQHLSDGYGMLVEQAAASFHFWTGFYPETSSLISSTPLTD